MIKIKKLAILLVFTLLITGCASPAEVPATSSQSVSTSVTTVPTTTASPTTESSATEPTVTEPPVTEPPVTEPPVTEPPATKPPVTEPPATKPPVTEPPATKPPIEEPPIEEPLPDNMKKITMTFVGDCTFGRNQKHTYDRSFDQMYDKKGPDYFFKKVRDIFENDDITVINLEGSLTTSTDIQDKMWNHKGDPEYVKIMTGSSVEVATMGNNHRLDYGQSGCDETEQVLSDAGIGYCYDDKYLIHEVDGVKVGFVSVNEHYDGRAVEYWLEDGYRYLREQGCKIVVACIHWGNDKTSVVTDYQIELGHKCIDWGYDLVVGNHPHVLQGMELYKGRLICYCLGNFCYGGNKNPDDKDSGIFQKTFTLIDGELVVDADARFIPCRLSGVDSRNDYQPTPAKGSVWDRIIDKMNNYNKRFGLTLDEDGRPIVP